MVGLRDRARDKVQTYSLGMKQRLGIAAALLSDPKLLLLDEPSNGLDPAGIVAMRETLRRLAALGKTVFVSSHILGEVQQLADVVGIIAAGRLVREGPIEQLLEGEGVVRVRVAPGRASTRARAVLDGIVAGHDVDDRRPSAGWLVARDRRRTGRPRSTGRWRRPGIYASGLETGNDLESLFLELTGGDDTRQATRARSSAPPGSGTTRADRQRRPGIVRLFVAGIRKLVRRPATFVTFGLLVGLLALIYIAVGATARQAATSSNGGAPGASCSSRSRAPTRLLLSFILGLGGLFAMIYGAAIAGSEWTWGTLKAAVARGESRSRYQLLSFAAIAVMVGIGLVVAFVDRDRRRDRRGRARRRADDRPERRGHARHAARAAGPRLAGPRRGGRARVRDRDPRPQPAGRDRRRDRGLLRRAVRDDLPARHRQVPAVQRRERGRRDLGQLRRGRRRRRRTVARLDPNTALLVVAAWLIGGLVVTVLYTERAEISRLGRRARGIRLRRLRPTGRGAAAGSRARSSRDASGRGRRRR